MSHRHAIQARRSISAWRTPEVLDLLRDGLHPTPRLFAPPDQDRAGQAPSTGGGWQAAILAMAARLRQAVGTATLPGTKPAR